MPMVVMDMYFYMGKSVVFLISDWTCTSAGVFLILCVVSFALAMAYQFLTTVKNTQNELKYTLVSMVRTLLAYVLMLILMTFNGGLFMSIILGHAVGYGLFGFAPVVLTQKCNCNDSDSQSMDRNLLMWLSKVNNFKNGPLLNIEPDHRPSARYSQPSQDGARARLADGEGQDRRRA